jgi:hypothetical protein
MKKVLLAAVMVVGATSVSAKYGSAGCGLGSELISSNNAFLQLTAGSTNGMSSQPLSITSGTSGCDSKLFGSNSEYFKFMKNNMDEVAMNISQGSGEYLETIAKFYKLDSSIVAQKLQANFENIYTHARIEAADVTFNIDKVLNS